MCVLLSPPHNGNFQHFWYKHALASNDSLPSIPRTRTLTHLSKLNISDLISTLTHAYTAAALAQQAYKVYHLVAEEIHIPTAQPALCPCRRSLFPLHQLSGDTKFPDNCNPPRGTPQAKVAKWTKPKGGQLLAPSHLSCLEALPCIQCALLPM